MYILKKKCLKIWILMSIMLSLYFCLKILNKKIFNEIPTSVTNLLNNNRTYPGFLEALDKHAKHVKWKESEMKFIILAMTDNSYTDVAINLYISSFKRYNIDNFLFVGGGSNACSSLIKHKIQCYDFWEDPDSNKPNNYGSKEFIRKMNIRTEMILQALKAKYSVLHSDLDIIFLQNPMPEIEHILEDKDMAILWDHEVYNAGFLGIKATNLSLHVYENIKRMTAADFAMDDQTALNNAINKLSLEEIKTSVHVLDKNRYLCGKDYYTADRSFAKADFTDNCPNCTVIHNNWIVSKEAKVYRFKETAMWYIDDDQYYSDVNRKYLLYSNPALNNVSNFYMLHGEMMALGTGLKIASMLNRTLILPRFHCRGNVECPFNNVFDINTFHDHFSPNYRECSFLLNDLVPWSISMKSFKNCSFIDNIKSQPLKTSTCNKQNSHPAFQCIPFKPIPILLTTDSNMNVDESLIRNKFNHCSDTVLTLSSLYGVEVKFSDPAADASFEERLGKAFKGNGVNVFLLRQIFPYMNVFDCMIICMVLIWLVIFALRIVNWFII